MANAQQQAIDTWDNEEGEMEMEAGHEPSWRAFISHLDMPSLQDKRVLDFGCNRGGFLRLLHNEMPFKEGRGVDIAEESVRIANKGMVPVSYGHSDSLSDETESFDVAFSHEVIYLLPDLAAHAQEMNRVLKAGGVYYCVIGEYAENPLWERWKGVVSEFSPVPPQTYSLQDIAKTFQDNGFDVSVRRLVCDGFLPYDANDTKYLHNPMELIEFMTEYMMLFRFEKK